MPRISSAKTAPIVANWSRCSARASAFAPASIRTRGAAGAREWERRSQAAGRRRRAAGRARPAASIAPVLPAETTASASPLGDGADGRDERALGLRANAPRPASRPCSTTRVVATSSRPARCRARRAVEDGTIPSARASSAPAITTSPAPRSPPIASTATRISRELRALRSVDAERLDLAALVRPAGRTNAMGALRLAAVVGTR